MSFDNSASFYEAIPEARIEQRPDGSTHVFVGSTKVRDGATPYTDDAIHDAPAAGEPYEIADPRRPLSGQGPSTSGFTCDFKRARDGKWVGQDRAGRRYRLRVSHDGSVYRVEEDRDGPPWSVRQRQGDRALSGDLTRVHDEARHQPGLTAWASRLSDFWKRKDGPEAA